MEVQGFNVAEIRRQGLEQVGQALDVGLAREGLVVGLGYLAI